MAHQLKAVLRQTLPLETAMSMCGGSDPEFSFDQIFEELYPLEIKEDNPYVLSNGERRSWREVGVTCAMILAFSRRLCISVHVLWGETKVLSYTPEAPATGLYLHTHGDHAVLSATSRPRRQSPE